MRTPLFAVDLFAGCGGLTLGLRRAGFRIAAAVEKDPLAVETYRANHPGIPVLQGDVREISVSQLNAHLGSHPLHLLAACPPCQSFSALVTMRSSAAGVDERRDLVLEVVRFVRDLKPLNVLIENVPGLLRDARFGVVVRALKRGGYKCRILVSNAADYGIPQRRERLVLLASRLGVPPEPLTSRTKRTVRDAIGSLPSPGDGVDPLHDYAELRNSEVRARIRAVPPDGGGRKDVKSKHRLRCHNRTNGYYDVYGRMAWDHPSPTITSGCISPSKGRFLHPVEHRAITLREACLLQGFPRNYDVSLSNGRYKAAELIGNAFPPGFAAAHARALKSLVI